MTGLPGVAGTLFPERYLLDRLPQEAVIRAADWRLERTRRHLVGWWTRAAETCGPASGIRAVFDSVAVPLFAILGFRMTDVVLRRDRIAARLETPQCRSVGIVVLPWAAHASTAWRELVVLARDWRTDWCFLVAPPFVSLVDVRGCALRRSVEFRLSEALDSTTFRVFWALARAGVFDRPDESTRTASHASEIDRLVAAAAAFQDGVRADLQHGVVEALDRLHGPEALTIVFRVLFLLFAESRRLVPIGHPIYAGAYTVSGLCTDAVRRDRAGGLWDGLAAISRLSRTGCRTSDLIVSPFNGALFARAAAPALEARTRRTRRIRDVATRDAALRSALVALSTRPGRAGREQIHYADLGVEQLGAVYERILDLPEDPGDTDVNERRSRGRFLNTATHSDRRKATGTFYTPQPLADFLVRRTLAPLVAGATSDGILSLRVVDPAMGSGAFLVAACRFLAAAYERALVDEGRLAAADIDDVRQADFRRLVAERCLAGVDLNPVAVQLARLSLWLVSLARGKPLGFLDHRLRVGDSLIGASPDDLSRTGGQRRMTEMTLFDESGLEGAMRQIARPLSELGATRDDSADAVRAKQAIWARLTSDRSPIDPWRKAADLWCARWFMHDAAPPSAPELRAALDAILRGDGVLAPKVLAKWLDPAARVAADRRFFHWTLEFADVFYDGTGRPKDRPGFDAVIGNPPWEMLRRDSGYAAGETDSRERPVRRERDVVRFIRESGLYPSCGRGHVNLYQPFLERSLALARPGGRVGLILPWGLAVDDGAVELRRRLLDTTRLETLVGFDNASGLFPIHRGVRFLAVVSGPGGARTDLRARFGVRTAAEIDTLPERDDPLDGSPSYPVRLSRATLARVGGSSRRIPDVRREVDLALLERIMEMFPPLGASGGWAASFGRELNATESRDDFGDTGLPVLEGKHISPFVVDATQPAARIARPAAERLLPDARFDRPRLAYRDVAGIGNRYTIIAALVPAGAVTTHTLFCLRNPPPLVEQHFLCALLNSYVLNLAARMLMGSHITTGLVEGLPAPSWRDAPRERRVARLAARLAAGRQSRGLTAWIQAEVARLYGLDRTAFDALLDTFPLVPPADRDRARLAFERSDSV